jgi:signal transduction histidine kinase/DNA-binding LacI/PurR family transcriptional regulator/AraC-like DNA-binding protein
MRGQLTVEHDRQLDRPTIAIVMRAFTRPDYDIWLAATRAAEAQGLNTLTYIGRALASPEGLDTQANFIYELINPHRLSGMIVLASGLGLYVGARGMRTFCDRFAGCPIVSLQMAIPGVPSVLVDNHRGMREVIDHLIDVHAHRRIAFLRGPVTHRGAEERYCAYREALEVHNLPFDPDLVKAPGQAWSDVPGIAKFLAQRGGTAPDYDAVVGASAGQAVEALNWLQARGVSVPETVALAGFDNFRITAGAIPALTTAEVDFDEMGRQAVALLVSQLAGESVPDTVAIPSRLLVQASCGCPNHSVTRATLCAPRDPKGGTLDAAESITVAYPPFRDPPPDRDSAGALDGAAAAKLAETLLAPQHSCLAAISPDLISELTQAFVADVRSASLSSSAFLLTLQSVLVRIMRTGGDVAAFQDVLSSLRQAMAEMLAVSVAEEDRGRTLYPWSAHPLWPIVEARLDQARVLVSDTARRATHARWMAGGQRMVTLRHLGHTLATVADLEQLGMTLAKELPSIDITGCYLALFEEPGNLTAGVRLHFAFRGAERLPLDPEGERFSASDLLPVDMLMQPDRGDRVDGPGEASSYVVQPLYVRDRQFGFIMVQVGPRDLLFEDQPGSGNVYDLLSGYVSDALHGILLYEDALRARQQAEEADRLKSRFLSMVSHELRTPLNLIVSLSEMLLWQQGGYQQELSRIHASAQHLDGLIRDVLDLASSQVGQLRLVREPLDLKQSLGVVTMIGEQMARDKGISWETEMPDALPLVWADRTRVRQIALNLVSNALRFTSEGGVRLRVTEDSRHITVAVSDSGIGVPLAEQETIFDEFKQSERTAARGYGGLGLGLAISRRLVEMHGGEIGVVSTGEEGAGATFFFTLPVMDRSLSEVEDDARDGEALPVDMAKRTVTLLSAQPGAGQRIRDYLSDRGYQVKELLLGPERSPNDPEVWLNQILLDAPGAVILDAEPAKEHGWTLMRRLKENPATQNIPVLFYALLQDEDSGSMLALDYLSKPIGMDDLAEALGRQGLLSMAGGKATAAGSCADSADGKACRSFTFLVVDDNPNVLATHTWLLQSQLPHSRVLQASNGRQALTLMRRHHPDLVLLDLMMPELSGFEVLSEMQQDPDLSDISVVVLTAKSLTRDAISRLTTGVTAVLGKGLFSAEETLERVEAALRVDQGVTLETQEVVRRAMVYLHEHYAEPLTRKDIAEHISLSTRHLDRCFCEQLGITPITYLNRFRIRQAKRLLRNSTLNMSEIAASVGFSDSAYFSRVFRRETGMSPTDYRRSQA